MTQAQKIIKYCAIAFAILLIVSIFSGIVGVVSSIASAFRKGSDIVGENVTHELSDLESVKNLEISIGAAALEIKNGEAFSLESNHKYLNVKVKNGTLVIEDATPSFLKNREGAHVILTVPSGFFFDRAEIETGAGNLTVESLCTEKLRMDLGAGETVFEDLRVTKQAKIETGFGKVSVLGGSVAGLEFGVGVGDVFLTFELTEDSEFECGIGNAEIVLLGSKENYTVSVETGIGSATVDGKSVSNDEEVGNGAVSLEIQGGIGNIQIAFAEREQQGGF
ncbi:MAG: DUF4097 domain-containing protein [Ruminococcaceae bacterium]|nr:DUF4097 domain-containing protein [Oscillospiraceae bacterium]